MSKARRCLDYAVIAIVAVSILVGSIELSRIPHDTTERTTAGLWLVFQCVLLGIYLALAQKGAPDA